MVLSFWCWLMFLFLCWLVFLIWSHLLLFCWVGVFLLMLVVYCPCWCFCFGVVVLVLAEIHLLVLVGVSGFSVCRRFRFGVISASLQCPSALSITINATCWTRSRPPSESNWNWHRIGQQTLFLEQCRMSMSLLLRLENCTSQQKKQKN